MSLIVKTIVLYGAVKDVPYIWMQWILFSEELFSKLFLNPNYIGIIGDSFKGSKCLVYKAMRKKVLNSIEQGKHINSLSLYSMPDSFTSTVFDYDGVISRRYSQYAEYISLTLRDDLFNTHDKKETINSLKKFIEFSNGEVFEMSRDEVPSFYFSKANPKEEFKTLKVLEYF